jgi:hypothetical protein
MAGGAADCTYWERVLSKQCRLYELRYLWVWFPTLYIYCWWFRILRAKKAPNFVSDPEQAWI